MAEIDEMKQAIAESLKEREASQQRINQAIDQVDQNRKDQRDKSARPD